MKESQPGATKENWMKANGMGMKWSEMKLGYTFAATHSFLIPFLK